MKSLEELKAIRDKMKGQIGMRSEHADDTTGLGDRHMLQFSIFYFFYEQI